MIFIVCLSVQKSDCQAHFQHGHEEQELCLGLRIGPLTRDTTHTPAEGGPVPFKGSPETPFLYGKNAWPVERELVEGEFCIVISVWKHSISGLLLFSTQMSICIPSDLNRQLSWLTSLYLHCVFFLWAALQYHRCAKWEEGKRRQGLEKSELQCTNRSFWVLFISLDSHLCSCKSNSHANLATDLQSVEETFRNLCFAK